MEPVRINKYLSDIGYCSRRAADKLLEDGKVTVNGKPAVLGQKVFPNDTILVNGKPIEKTEDKVYIAFNKPAGITCTSEKSDKDNIIDFINFKTRIYPVGRLDKPSQGLIFLTNDGEWANKIAHARNLHEKEYAVRVDKPLTEDFINQMRNGVNILDTTTRKTKIYKKGEDEFNIVLTQGLNRQIRRMCEALGYKVLKLKRIRIMNITLKGLKTGEWRYLTPNELAAIDKLLIHSK